MTHDQWVKSPIDQFVLEKLQDEGLAPSPAASPEKLIRRIYLDLIGLPPTPAAVMQFVDDPTDERLESIVDELMQRPQFGERWARPWLDLARYADSHGFQRDNLRDNWAYRDWVIRALNEDMPFDQFTIEQIAGDLLPNATESQKIATGFHRCAPTNVEAGSLPEETRTEQVVRSCQHDRSCLVGNDLGVLPVATITSTTRFPPKSITSFWHSTIIRNPKRTEPSKNPSSIAFQGPYLDLSDPDRDAERAELNAQLAEVKREIADRRRELAKSLEAWVFEAAVEAAEAPQTHTLNVLKFDSQGTTDRFEKLDDGSILLVGGDPPDKDIYTLWTNAEISGIQAIRLDVLRDDSLPGGGPGRGDPKRRNFVSDGIFSGAERGVFQ